jgi:hypothetical protein
MASKLHRIIWAAKTVKRSGQDDKTYWTRIGVSFLNEDGSENLSFDFYPTDPNTTLQLRVPKPKDD